MVFIGWTVAKQAKPGQCSKSKLCDKGTCVSVQNSIAGLELTSQCTLDPICGGVQAGACPTFSSWPSSYDIQPVCHFVLPDNCAEVGTLGNEEDDTVTCYNLNVTIESNETIDLSGIYKCIDRTFFENDTRFPTVVIDEALSNCAGNSSDAQLCNGQGTCIPSTALDVDYECQCNLGYSNADNCFEPTSNSCNNLGQCGDAGECNTSTNICDCKIGTGGNQCASCTSDEGCGGLNGKCSADGECICSEGYKGKFCRTKLGGGSTGVSFRSPSLMMVWMSLFAGLLVFY